MDDFIKAAIGIMPDERQLAWQELEFYAFMHFGINTFTDREWGYGNESPSIFNPVQLDADQWVEVCKSAGMKGLILTCKHHDGFCLWPSRYTAHSVGSSPWKDGKGDVVGEVAAACKKGGLKFGIYLSPWDRHEKTYGDSGRYNRFYINQLKELLTAYGDIFCVWLDGACGEGAGGKRQAYDWESYYRTVRELQPNAVISVCGPDVRWCGNEAGHCRESEWSVVPAYLKNAELTMDKSQKSDDAGFSKKLNSDAADLGSRESIRNAGRLAWYPAEVNTSIRPGWFYHASEDDRVKTVDELLRIYYNSVGGNAGFLLNIPPDRRGLIHENDAARLQELGNVLRKTFGHDLAEGASCLVEMEIDLEREKTFDRIVLMEEIKLGQRVEAFTLSYMENGVWRELFKGTVIGHKRICCFPKATTRFVKLVVSHSRANPIIKSFRVYNS